MTFLSFGDRDDPEGTRSWFGIPPEEVGREPSDLWNIHVVGQPGFGKTHFLANLALQAHALKEGALVLDIKGAMAKHVVKRAMDIDRVIYVAPGEIINEGLFWSLNPFEHNRASALARNQAAESLPLLFEYIGD